MAVSQSEARELMHGEIITALVSTAAPHERALFDIEAQIRRVAHDRVVALQQIIEENNPFTYEASINIDQFYMAVVSLQPEDSSYRLLIMLLDRFHKVAPQSNAIYVESPQFFRFGDDGSKEGTIFTLHTVPAEQNSEINSPESTRLTILTGTDKLLGNLEIQFVGLDNFSRLATQLSRLHQFTAYAFLVEGCYQVLEKFNPQT